MMGHNHEAAAFAGDLMHTHIHHYVFRHTMERRTDPILAHTMLGSGAYVKLRETGARRADVCESWLVCGTYRRGI